MKKLLGLTVSVLALGVTANAAENWDMPMAYPANNYHTENAQAFVDRVEACTGGELKITIHANGSLFKGNEIKRAVQVGEAQIGERILSAHANENPIFGFDNVPFLATSFEASDKLRDAARPVINKVLNDQNLTLLYSVPWPPQGFYFAKEVNSKADVAGVKFRAYNAATAEVAERLGMSPTQIEAAELKQALSTGVVSAFISSGSTGTDEKVWEDLTHFYDAKAWLPRNSIFVNNDAFGALPEASQKCLMDEAAVAETMGSEQAAALADGFVQELADNGMIIAEPAGDFSNDLSEVGAAMTENWLKEAGADGQAIVDAYK